MKNIIEKILMFTSFVIILAMAILIIIPIFIIIWLGVFVSWLSSKDGVSHNKPPIAKPDAPKDDYLESIECDEDRERFDAIFAKKPFPEPYNPSKNPLYLKPEGFDKEKVFAAVDDSNVRMSNMSKKERHALAG